VDRPMNHDTIIELLGAFALDAVDPDEAAAVREHLAGCPRCRDEVAQHHQTAGLLAPPGDEPPAHLWEGISARLGQSPPAAEPVPLDVPQPAVRPRRAPERPARSRWGLRVGALVAVAAAAAIAALGVEVGRLDHRLNRVAASTGAQDLSDAARNALLNPQTQRILLSSPGPNSQVLAEVVAGSPSTAFLFNRGLPALPSARTYQLWLTGPGRTISMGLLGSNPGTVAFALGPTLPSRAFAVTVEPANGSVVPTLPIVASGQA
jgi:anti-sigma factor RsiW